MPNSRYLPAASQFYILEGNTSSNSSCEPLFSKRIEFRETLLNERVFRISQANLKIEIAIKVLEEYNIKRHEALSPTLTLEHSIVEDFLLYNILEVAELISNFKKILPEEIRINFGTIFRRSRKAFKDSDELVKNKYEEARTYLFPTLSKNADTVNQQGFENLADCLNVIAETLLRYRNKILAHKYDKERFLTHLAYEEYYKIVDEFKKILDSISIVATFSLNDWSTTRSLEEIVRVEKWLTAGLVDSLPKPIAIP